MARMIHCQKLNKLTEGLEAPPYPGEYGQWLYEHISQEAWRLWLEHQTRLINEYRLNLMDSKSRQFLTVEMKKFFANEDISNPPGYKE